MRIKSWTIAGLVVIFCIPVPAAQDVAELLHRQTQELMDAVGNGTRSVWERYLDAGAVYTDEGGSVMSKPGDARDHTTICARRVRKNQSAGLQDCRAWIDSS